MPLSFWKIANVQKILYLRMIFPKICLILSSSLVLIILWTFRNLRLVFVLNLERRWRMKQSMCHERNNNGQGKLHRDVLWYTPCSLDFVLIALFLTILGSLCVSSRGLWSSLPSRFARMFKNPSRATQLRSDVLLSWVIAEAGLLEEDWFCTETTFSCSCYLVASCSHKNGRLVLFDPGISFVWTELIRYSSCG